MLDADQTNGPRFPDDNTTLIKVASTSTLSLKLLLREETKKSNKSVLATIQGLFSLSENGDFISIKEIMEAGEHKPHTISRFLSHYRDSGFIDSIDITNEFPDISRSRSVYIVNKIGVVTTALEKIKEQTNPARTLTGRASAKAVMNQLEALDSTARESIMRELQVDDLPANLPPGSGVNFDVLPLDATESGRDQFRHEKTGYQVMHVEGTVANLIAPGRELLYGMSSKKQSGEGYVKEWSNSLFGVMNDFDELTLTALLRATDAYIENMNLESTEGLHEYTFPLWIDDIAAARNVNDRMLISESIFRILATEYWLNTADNIRHGDIQGDHQLEKFNYFSRFKIITGKTQTLGDPVQIDMFSELKLDGQETTGEQLLRNLHSQFGEHLPLICVLVQYDKRFFEQNVLRKNRFLHNREIEKLPETIYAIHREVRRDYYSTSFRRMPWESESQGMGRLKAMSLAEFVKVIWPSQLAQLDNIERENEKIWELCKSILSSLKALAKSAPKLCSIHRANDGQSLIKLQVFGVHAVFQVPNLDRIEFKTNLHDSFVTASIVEELVLASADMKYRKGGKSGNKQRPLEENKLLKAFPDRPTRRSRRLPASIVGVRKAFDSFRARKYDLYITIGGKEYFLSGYTSPQTLSSLSMELAHAIDLDDAYVRVALESSVEKLERLEGFTLERLESFASEYGFTVNQVVIVLVERARHKGRILKMKDSEFAAYVRATLETLDLPNELR